MNGRLESKVRKKHNIGRGCHFPPGVKKKTNGIISKEKCGTGKTERGDVIHEPQAGNPDGKTGRGKFKYKKLLKKNNSFFF